MCGITGIVQRRTAPDRDLVMRMQQALEHRGPDSGGEFFEGSVALAMRRLSIVAPKHGDQPFYSTDGEVVAVVNGEIYNYPELKSHLTNEGYALRTSSDCAVVVGLYEMHGENFVRFLRGMFAVALWDRRSARLILARDRMGEKPLYYVERGDTLLFSSEMKALAVSGAADRKIDLTAADLYFHFNYVPEPHSFFAGIRKLPAGHSLTVDVNNWEVSINRYWHMLDAEPVTGDPVDVIREGIEDIGSIIFQSDQPIGIALSGGVDSSLAAALAARFSKVPTHVFSVGYKTTRTQSDESGQAKELSDLLGFQFHRVELGAEDLVTRFTELATSYDEPISDIAGLAYLEIMAAAHDAGVPVIFMGHGGDELCWGYDWVRASVALNAIKDDAANGGTLPASVAELSAAIEFQVPRNMTFKGLARWLTSGLRRHEERHIRSLYDDPSDGQLISFQQLKHYWLTQKLLAEIGGPGRCSSASHRAHAAILHKTEFDAANDLELTELICRSYLRENGLAQGDRLSMARSVEVRQLLVDHMLVEKVIGLRKLQPDHELSPKHFIKQAASHIIPRDVLLRPKRGFNPAYPGWKTQFRNRYRDQLYDGVLYESGFLDREQTHKLLFKNALKGTDLEYKIVLANIWHAAI